jgi:hypothetical protein
LPHTPRREYLLQSSRPGDLFSVLEMPVARCLLPVACSELFNPVAEKILSWRPGVPGDSISSTWELDGVGGGADGSVCAADASAAGEPVGK